MRPDWWEPWIPERDSEGHGLAPGTVSKHRCGCLHDVHHVVRCRVNGCKAEPARPPDCGG